MKGPRELKKRQCKHLVVPLALKEVTEEGTFNGTANMMELVDLVRDNIHAGAFAKTLAEAGPMRFLLADHETDLQNRIGAVELRENGNQLEVTKGEFNLDKAAGRDAYADAKFYHDRGIPLGLSIGYDIPKGKSYVENGVRHITEIILYEVSIVPWPANQESWIGDVKGAEQTRPARAAYLKELFTPEALRQAAEEVGGSEAKYYDNPMTMQEMLAGLAEDRMWWTFDQINWALWYVLDDLYYNTIQMDAAEVSVRAEEALQIHAEVMAAWVAEMAGRYGAKALPPRETREPAPIPDEQSGNPPVADTQALDTKAEPAPTTPPDRAAPQELADAVTALKGAVQGETLLRDLRQFGKSLTNRKE